MKRLTRSIAALLFVGSLLSGGAAIAAPAQGGSELLVSGGFFHQEDSDTGNLNFDLSYGAYLTPGWQLGIRQALNYNFVDDHRDFWIATTAPFVNYHFRLTDIIFPYLGAFIGLCGVLTIVCIIAASVTDTGELGIVGIVFLFVIMPVAGALRFFYVHARRDQVMHVLVRDQ